MSNIKSFRGEKHRAAQLRKAAIEKAKWEEDTIALKKKAVVEDTEPKVEVGLGFIKMLEADAEAKVMNKVEAMLEGVMRRVMREELSNQMEMNLELQLELQIARNEELKTRNRELELIVELARLQGNVPAQARAIVNHQFEGKVEEVPNLEGKVEEVEDDIVLPSSESALEERKAIMAYVVPTRIWGGREIINYEEADIYYTTMQEVIRAYEYGVDVTQSVAFKKFSGAASQLYQRFIKESPGRGAWKTFVEENMHIIKA